MTILTREQIVALMALVGEATDGPWQVLHIVDTHPEFDTPDLVEVVTSDDSPSVATICRVSTDGDDEVSAVLADAAFIAATRTGVPDLIATARAYHDLRDAVLALHKPYRIYDKCDCTPEQIEASPDDHVYALDIGTTCALQYVICRECCCDVPDREYQTETCASYHEHSKDTATICDTVEAVARVERGE